MSRCPRGDTLHTHTATAVIRPRAEGLEENRIPGTGHHASAMSKAASSREVFSEEEQSRAIAG
jgi:hypothetical protein